MKIATKSFGWTDPMAGEGVSAFYLFYAQGNPPFSYDLPKVVVPAVPGQTEYVYTLPGAIPLTEGEWTIWVAASDQEGNISDAPSVTRPFDFTPPSAPINVRVF